MTGITRRTVATVFAGTALAVGVATPAAAQQQDGLVNVNVGDITTAVDVTVAGAALVAANVCGLDVGPIAVLGEAVDLTGEEEVVCETDQGPVTILQN
jgi:hypothetical protein